MPTRGTVSSLSRVAQTCSCTSARSPAAAIAAWRKGRRSSSTSPRARRDPRRKTSWPSADSTGTRAPVHAGADHRARTRLGMLQLGELGAGERNPPLRRAEVHKHGMVLHAEYDAESVLVVGHLIVDGECLGRGRRSGGAERAVGEVA